MKDEKEQIGELFLNVISEFYEMDRRARNFGTDTELYHSEIHMLQCIRDNPGLHISGLGRTLGITRGAASQTAKRLESKGMIVKKSDPVCATKVVLYLTPKGATACRSHSSAHRFYEALISELLKDSAPEQAEFLVRFLRGFEQRAIPSGDERKEKRRS